MKLCISLSSTRYYGFVNQVLQMLAQILNLDTAEVRRAKILMDATDGEGYYISKTDGIKLVQEMDAADFIHDARYPTRSYTNSLTAEYGLTVNFETPQNKYRLHFWSL